MKENLLYPEAWPKIVNEKGVFTIRVFSEFGQRPRTPQLDYAFYTMREFDHSGLISAKNIYMNAVDEYDAAIKLVGTWSNWLKLLKKEQFMKGEIQRGRGYGYVGLEQWREEKRLKEYSKALAILEKEAERGNVSAAKFILDSVKPDGRGRPVKHAVENIAKKNREDELIRNSINVVKLASTNDNTRKQTGSDT